MVVKANHERGDEIKFLSEVGQRPKRFNLLDYAANAEQMRNLPEHGQTIHIKPESGMTQQLRYIQKIACAAAKVENALGPRQIELGLANSANVDSDPTIEIEILGPVCARIGYCVTLANLPEPDRIDRFDNPVFIQREPASPEKPERMFPRANQAPAIYKLPYLMSKSHLKMNHTL